MPISAPIPNTKPSVNRVEAFTTAVGEPRGGVDVHAGGVDGGEFGMGAEMGNSTQKLHARGPIALRELTTSKYVVHGTGQVRE